MNVPIEFGFYGVPQDHVFSWLASHGPFGGLLVGLACVAAACVAAAVMSKDDIKQWYISQRSAKTTRHQTDENISRQSETTEVVGYRNPDLISAQNDSDGEYIDIDFNNLDRGKHYLVKYGGKQYVFTKTSDDNLSTTEVAG